nr:hypothetical protein Iba_chr03dCG9500 [Ipomoea batatas]
MWTPVCGRYLPADLIPHRTSIVIRNPYSTLGSIEGATPAELVGTLAPMLVDHRVGRAVGTYTGLPPCSPLK